MAYISRLDHWNRLYPEQPAYRWQQLQQAIFSPTTSSWLGVTAIPLASRQQLQEQVPWLAHTVSKVFTSAANDTFKAVLEAADGLRYETVLMANVRDQWTICVSSQIGCAMACTFCATGTMGLKRSLHADEIVDQYRHWKNFLAQHPELPQRISNIVFMGMGEPLANYDQVKDAITTILKYTDIGPTHITVSTVGLLPRLEQLLEDATWPPVRLAISLHSANAERRLAIVPTTVPDFLPKLADWCRRYGTQLGNRRHHLTFEFTLIHEVNDTPEHAKELGKYIQKTGVAKINVIPYNPVPGKDFNRSQQDRIDAFKAVIRSFGIDITQRRTMGDDIAAACGQLVYQNQPTAKT